MNKINTIIIQPPLVQLNSPYPSGAYLLSFFNELYKEKNLLGKVQWFDFSNDFFHLIFSKSGLRKIFDSTSQKAIKMANDFEKKNDQASAFELRRFLSQAENWINWIDIIISILCPTGKNNLSGKEFVHEFVRGAHVPRGARMERFLSTLERDVTTDDCKILSSLALADLADYITMVYDNNFELIRYAEHLASSTSSFKKVQKGLSSPSLIDFFKPLILEKLSSFKDEATLFCISVPFPGCFEAAVFLSDVIKKEGFSNCLIAFGGGYINTELRNISEERLFDYCDFISYDKGYGNYLELFDVIQNELKEGDRLNSILNGNPYYNCSYRFNDKIIMNQTVSTSIDLKSPSIDSQKLINDGAVASSTKDCENKLKKIEKEYVRKLAPDYSSIDFSKYPRLADDKNPMHRIWNDGAWLKAYIAHGCYWHRCAFCDTQLDYVKDYCLTDVNNLFDKLYEQAKKTGVHGIHFVDEACPPIALEKFALKNLSLKSKENSLDIPLTFWGNIRFEKTFTRDLADLLSAGGMTAVSAGIEIATGAGLDSVNKGTDLKNIIFACCAFKEAGILIHSYMIYGFWNQTEQDLINSMETLRQMFACGLLDSAFWHKFTLTYHSTVYDEYKNGLHPKLKILKQKDEQFAKNDLSYEGQDFSEKYSSGLNIAVENWMHSIKLEKNVESYFPFKMPRPTIQKDFVEKIILEYEKTRDEQFLQMPSESQRFVWLAGNLIELDSSKNFSQLCWSYMGELFYADVKKDDVKRIVDCISKIKCSSYAKVFALGKESSFTDSSNEESSPKDFSASHLINELGKDLFFEFRKKGLCKLI